MAFGARTETGWAAGVTPPRDKGDEELNHRDGKKARKDRLMKRSCKTEKCAKTKRSFTKHRKNAWGLGSKSLFELDYFLPEDTLYCNLNCI